MVQCWWLGTIRPMSVIWPSLKEKKQKKNIIYIHIRIRLKKKEFYIKIIAHEQCHSYHTRVNNNGSTMLSFKSTMLSQLRKKKFECEGT